MEFFGYMGCFCIGLVLGLIGGGGSILCIPILFYLFSVDIMESTAYSLFVVGVTSLVGSLQRHKKALVDFRVAMIFGLPLIITKFCTRKWGVPLIPEVLFELESLLITKRLFMLGIFSLLVITAAATMIWKNWNLDRDIFGKNNFFLGIYGALIGILTGISGLGGGFIIMPTLVFIAKIKFKKAVGTSLLIICMSSLIGFTGDLWHTEINWAFLGLFTSIAILGIITGNVFSQFIPSLHLRKSFGWFILVMGVSILIKELSHLL